MINLNTLQLSSTKVTDISSLNKLVDLTYLNLNSVQISDISVISNYTKLTNLYLNRVYSLTDISPLSGLTQLIALEIAETEITDFSPLSGLSNLTLLKAGWVPIQDISPLTGLNNLEYLDLNHTSVKDVSPLSGLSSLEYLDISYTNASGIKTLSDTTSLKTLIAVHAVLNDDDISTFANLENIEHLDLYWNSITDITPISELPNLTFLKLYSNNIYDVSPLANLPVIENLDIGLNHINDISSLSSLTDTLTTFKAYQQNVTLDPISVIIDDMITTNYIVDIDRNIIPVELGVPVLGINNMSTIWRNGDSVYPFEGTVYQEVTYLGTPVITGDSSANTPEETALTDNELISLFNIEANDFEEGNIDSIGVNQSSVDYSTPGDYDVIFTTVDEEGNSVSKTVTITIIDESSEIIDPETPDVTDPDDVTSENSTEDNSTQMSLATTGGKVILSIVELLAITIVALGVKRFTKEV